MGEVFAAVRTGPGGFRRAVALKRLIDDESVRGAAVQRFLAEARILSSLHHPNVIEVYDVITADRGYVLVMELLTGATLGHIVRAASLSPEDICAIADQALAGLAYIHAARDEAGRPLGLVHRDLTPNNLFITEAGEVKLIDFGIAKLREALDAPVTREGELHGTLELIAPEQARGDPPDPRTDLYQLAGSLYWALSGRYPHGSGTTVELVTRAALVAPTPLRELRPELPAALAATIDRAMALEPDDRFGDAAEMRAALRTLVPPDGEARLAARVRGLTGEAEPIVAAPAPASRDEMPATVQDRPSARRGEAPAAAPVRRRRWAVAGAIAGAVAVAGGGAALWLGRARDAGSTFPVVPGSEGAIAATPLGNGRLAIATAGEVKTIAETGGDARPIAIPADHVPVDVGALADGHVAMTLQRPDGWLRAFVESDLDKPVTTAIYAGIIAVRPDGAMAAKAPFKGYAELDRGDNRTIVRASTSTEHVPAIAWSPDGSRVATIHERWKADPTIEIYDVASATAKVSGHVPFGGDVAAFGWLDGDHLAYAVNRADGATLYKLEVTSQREQEIARLPGERVVGGHAAAGAIAFLHGVPKHALLLGNARELGAEAIDSASAIAGFDAAGRVVYARDDGAVVARGTDGVTSAWPDARPHDVPEAIIDGDLLVRRDGVLQRLGSTSARLIALTAPAATAPIRCAGDAAGPCIAAVASDLDLAYRTYKPEAVAKPTEFAASENGLDHAVSRDGTRLAIVDGTYEIHVFDLTHKSSAIVKAGIGSSCEHVAWLGDELIVSARHWRQHPWALLAIDASGEPRMIAESRVRIAAELRVSGDTLAVAATDVTPVLSVLRP